MSGRNLSSATWNSPNEQVITKDVENLLLELQRIDSVWGKRASSKYGSNLGNIQVDKFNLSSLILKIFRKVRFEFYKYLEMLFGRGFRLFLRHWRRRINDYSRIDNETKFVFKQQNRVLKVEYFSLTTAGIKELLNNTDADYWILTREPGQFTRQGQKAIEKALSHELPELVIGDNRDRRGFRYSRPKINSFHIRQVDLLGPVVMVRTRLLQQTCLGISPNLWPVAVGLATHEQEIQYIPVVLGVGDPNYAFQGLEQDELIDLVNSDLEKKTLSAQILKTGKGTLEICYKGERSPKVSIVIPTAGFSQNNRYFVVEAVRSIIHRSSYQNFEIVIIADTHTPQLVVDLVDEIGGERIIWVRFSEIFNFSKKVNLGAVVSSGEYLLFLNDDTEVVSNNWIEQLLNPINVENIAYTGGLLFFEDQTIQHAGHIYKGGAGHVGFGESFLPNDLNQYYSLDFVRDGVTAACSLISADLFNEIGGFCEDFPGNFNDVDFALKVREAGYFSAVSGGARLYHFESKSRDPKVSQYEIDTLFKRWFTKIVFPKNY